MSAPGCGAGQVEGPVPAPRPAGVSGTVDGPGGAAAGRPRTPPRERATGPHPATRDSEFTGVPPLTPARGPDHAHPGRRPSPDRPDGPVRDRDITARVRQRRRVPVVPLC